MASLISSIFPFRRSKTSPKIYVTPKGGFPRSREKTSSYQQSWRAIIPFSNLSSNKRIHSNNLDKIIRR